MDAHQPPAPRTRRTLNDAALLMLSATLAFFLWFGGGWLLASQIELTADERDSSRMNSNGLAIDVQRDSGSFEAGLDARLECSPDTWASPGETQTTGY